MNIIKIIEFEPWMKGDVIKLFRDEYNIDEKKFEKKFGKLYDEKFQKERCIRIVALNNQEIIGFQSYFYWPYKNGKITYNSFQSGNSIVSKYYRGQGIFGLMLEKIDEIIFKRKIDFLIGFPVKESIGSFKRKKWINSTNLSWYIKPISYNPLFFLKPQNLKLKKEKLHFNFKMNGYIALENNQSFNEYRNKFSGEKLYFQYQEMNNVMRVVKDLKLDVIQKKFEIECELTFSIRKSQSEQMQSIFALNHKVKLVDIVTISETLLILASLMT